MTQTLSAICNRVFDRGDDYLGHGPDAEIFIWSFAWWPHALLHAQNFSLDTLRRSDMVFRVAEGNALPERRKGYEQQNADGQASLNRPSTKALHRTQYLF